jgi:hypothetical protein
VPPAKLPTFQPDGRLEAISSLGFEREKAKTPLRRLALRDRSKIDPL